MSDANNQATSQEGEGSSESGTPNPEGTSQPDELSLARRRQAGAEAARQAAESKNKEYEAELAKYRAAAQTDSEKDLSELAATKARLEAAEQRAAEAENKANARILDARFPTARAKLPELTDEVRLAEFEAILATGGQTPRTPERHNESKTGTPRQEAKKRSVADIEAELLSSPIPW